MLEPRASKVIRLSKHWVLVFLLGSLNIFFDSCDERSPNDRPPEVRTAFLEIVNPPTMVTAIGRRTFTLTYNLPDYLGGKLWLCVYKEGFWLSPLLPVPTIGLSTTSGQASLDFYFPTEGNYRLTACACFSGSNNNPPGLGDKQSAEHTLSIHDASQTINLRYKVAMYETPGNPLFPNYSNPNYDGFADVASAFAGGSTWIHVTANKENVPGQVLFRSYDEMTNWAHTVIASPKEDPYTCFIFSITDAAIPDLQSGDVGVTLVSVPARILPSFSFVISGRIRTLHPEHPEQETAMTWTAIHELGHGRGIDGDDRTYDLDPPHADPHADICIMRTPAVLLVGQRPVFCEGHNDHLRRQTW